MIGLGTELENLVDAYVDTFRSFLNGSAVYERITSLAENPGKFASLSEDMGRVLVNGSLGYADGSAIRLRHQFFMLFRQLHALYDNVPGYLDYNTWSANDHDASCSYDGPCFARTMNNFDTLTGNTKSILKQVAAPFKHLVTYYRDLYGIPFYMERASEERTEDTSAWHMVDRCAGQYTSSTDRACDQYGGVRTRTVERALQAIDHIMGPTCEETDNVTLLECYDCEWYEDACKEWKLTPIASNRCFQNALVRYSNYSTKVYESFSGYMGMFLLMELDIFGSCRPIAEARAPIANFTERRQEVLELVQGIAKQLLPGKKLLDDEGAGKSKNWTELARTVVHAGINVVAKGSDLSYPSPDDVMEKYRKVGDAIIGSIRANKFNEETYRYKIVVYKPEEVCLVNSNEDVAQGGYKNVNYLVSRVHWRLTSALASRIQKDNATIRALFGESTKKDLYERVRDLEDALEYKFTGEGGFRTMLVTKCARKFVWYELAWQHFDATWSTSNLHLFVSRGNYDAQCVSLVLIP